MSTSTLQHTADEMMAVEAARRLGDGDVCFVGIGLPSLAANLARATHAPGCVLYFVQDHPRREWCSTACGNRARVARHYDRHHRQAT